MRGVGSGPDDFDSFLQERHPAIFSARMLAQRLEGIIRDAGEGISETLYRRTRDAVLRGNHEFITADMDNGRVLRQLMRQGPSVPVAGPTRPEIGLPGDPRRLRESWEDLSASDRIELFRMDPFLGNRDGIPNADRDLYNRRNLDNLIRQAQDNEDYQRVEVYNGLKHMLEDSGSGQPRLYLSYLDEDGKMAFSLDDPDHSDNTAVLLRPAGHNGDEFGYAKPTMEQLRQLALVTAPGSRTSVSFWGAYQQPQSMVQAIFPQFAQDGAAGVRAYHEGLRATHEGSSAHITTIGHSYASVLAGHSAGDGGALNTDDIVFMGSWGTGVGHSSELRLTGVEPENGGEHVFSTISASDHVHLMPGTHGPEPSDQDFGARVFESESIIPGSYNAYDHDADAYLYSANPASGNIGLIIAGHGDLVS